MIIRNPPKITNRNSTVKYIEIDLWSWLRDLVKGLLKINFNENFQSFTVENISIAAGAEAAITNQFNSIYPGTIPSGRIIIRQQGNANIIDSTKAWTSTHLYLLNPSANDAIVTIMFFK